jgi:hypothetical protein
MGERIRLVRRRRVPGLSAARAKCRRASSDAKFRGRCWQFREPNTHWLLVTIDLGDLPSLGRHELSQILGR